MCIRDSPWYGDRADASGVLDVAAAHGVLYRFVASDDSHRYQGEAGRAFTMVPVSYTHLDVYKRQDQRHQDIIDERINNAGKRSADHYPGSQFQNIAFSAEAPEFFQKIFH